MKPPDKIRTTTVSLPTGTPAVEETISSDTNDATVEIVSHENLAPDESQTVTEGELEVDSAREAKEPAVPEPAERLAAVRRWIDYCAEFDGAGFFQDREARLAAMLDRAYPLALALPSGGQAAVALAIRAMPSETRKRAPSTTKAELLAVRVTAKPMTEAQGKNASDYAAVLLVARTEGVAPEAFRAWFREQTIADCRVKAKAIRAGLKKRDRGDEDGEENSSPPATAPATPPEPDTTWMAMSYGQGSAGVSLVAAMPAMVFTTLPKRPETSDEPITLVAHLRALANAIQEVAPEARFIAQD